MILAASYQPPGTGGSLRIVASSSSTPTPTPETISTPATPSGPSNGSLGTSYTYSTGGSTSSLGHTVQYQFDWGDGSTSVWLPVGTTNASHSWFSSGTYSVRALARCTTHMSVDSDLSAGRSVTIGASPTPSCPPTITQSSSQTITPQNSVSCGTAGIHVDTSYWRAFNMASFTGSPQYNVTSVSFGVEIANDGGGVGQPMTVRLYTNNGGAFPSGTRTQIATTSVTVMDRRTRS